MTKPLWIDDAEGLERLVDTVVSEPAYGLDTEFHRERTYFPHLALVQLSWSSGIAVIDPIAVDVAPLRRLLESPGLMICHAAEQDLEVLWLACGTRPSRLFDTQIAAAFVGLGFAALGRLVTALTGATLAKGDRLTDWTRRPLDESQIAYAAADVEHLLPMHRALVERARAAGTLAWIEEECENLRLKVAGPPEAETAWWRIKGSRSLRGKARGVAQEVAAWRERVAMARDIPPRFVLPDLALAGIVQRPPRTREQLAKVRGLEPRHVRGAIADEIFAAIERGLALDPKDLRLPARGEPPVDEDVGPSVALGLALIAQIAAQRRIEPSLLGTRADVQLLAAGRRTGRLSTGWRAELAGTALRRLLAGEAALTGDGNGGVRLLEVERGPGDDARGVPAAE
ncbi:MAG TPA: HRDC domain-containing protein [Candidatus Binatia bacterium]